MSQTQTSPSAPTTDPDKSKPKPQVKCAQPGCKKVIENEDAATKDGWYLDPHGLWHCYQHLPRSFTN